MIVENRKNISIDFKDSKTYIIPRFFQYDNNILVIDILDGGQNADLSNVDRIYLNFKKNDGSIITRSVLSNLSGNVLSYTLGAAEQEFTGIVKAELQIYDNTDRLSTFIFKIRIDDTINPEEPTADEQTFIDTIIAELNSLNIETKSAADYAKLQGDYAKEQAEKIGELESGVISVNGKTGIVTLDINELNNVSISNVSDGNTLVYDSDTSKWVNISSSEYVEVLKTDLNTVYSPISHTHSLSDVENGTEYSETEMETLWNNTNPEGA